MDCIVGKARQQYRAGITPGQFTAGGKDGAGIQQRSNHKEHRNKRKDNLQDLHCPGFGTAFLRKEQSRQESTHTVGQHLPGCPGALGIEKITGKGRDRTGHKSGLWSEGHAGNHNDAGAGFEIGHRNGHTAGYRQGCHHRNGYQLPGLGLFIWKQTW